eukprot:3169487-Amphidinium_carterae.1
MNHGAEEASERLPSNKDDCDAKRASSTSKHISPKLMIFFHVCPQVQDALTAKSSSGVKTWNFC